MATKREREAEVLARRAPAPAMAAAGEMERVAAAGAPARRKKFRGVTYLSSGKYGAGINKPGSKKRTWLGTYADEQVAACAYDLAARGLHGPKAKTNFDYPPPSELIKAVTDAPGRRGPVYPAPPPPAPASAATPPAAPAPVPLEHVDSFSFKAPPREPEQIAAYPFAKYMSPSRAKPGMPAPAPAAKIKLVRSIPPKWAKPGMPALAPDAKIKLVRSIPPKRFSIRDLIRVTDPVDLFAPLIRIVAPASSAETCFSSTTPDTQQAQLRDSASSSWRKVSNSPHLMLKTPKIFAMPTTAPTPSTNDKGFTGDNFKSYDKPIDFTDLPPSLPPSALMPLDVSTL